MKRVTVVITQLRMFVAPLNIHAEKFVISSLTVAFMIARKYVIKVSVMHVLSIRVE